MIDDTSSVPSGAQPAMLNKDCPPTELRDQLERERQRLSAEICAYPAPIPACDAYFNFLLEERARIADLLSRLCVEKLRDPLSGR